MLNNNHNAWKEVWDSDSKTITKSVIVKLYKGCQLLSDMGIHCKYECSSMLQSNKDRNVVWFFSNDA